MIVDDLRNKDLYLKLGEKFKQAFDILQKAKNEDPNGKIYVNEEIYYFVQEYHGKEKNEARMEAHKNYLDIQYIVSGEEIIDYMPINETTAIEIEYNANKDIIFLKGEGNPIHMKENMFMLLFPEDAHGPGIRVNDNLIKKVVIKIKA